MRFRRILTATSVVSPWMFRGGCAVRARWGQVRDRSVVPRRPGERVRLCATQSAILPDTGRRAPIESLPAVRPSGRDGPFAWRAERVEAEREPLLNGAEAPIQRGGGARSADDGSTQHDAARVPQHVQAGQRVLGVDDEVRLRALAELA